MINSKKDFIKEFENVSKSLIGKNASAINEYQCFLVTCNVIKILAQSIHAENREKIRKEQMKDIYYFSMEFLIGRLLNVYLINLNIKDIVKEGLADLGFDLDNILQYEKDPGLGNGGLGRLAACFMDSLASLGINSMGMGVRYRFGLFKQKIVNGEQIEVADNWLDTVYPWENKRDDRICKVRFGGKVDREYNNGKIDFIYKDYDEILAVPYDIPIVGFKGKMINRLRLWYAQPIEEKFDLDAFNKGNYSKAVDYRNKIEAISSILYPDDSNQVGKLLRLQQEYLLVSAGIQDVVARYKRRFGTNFVDMPSLVSIQLNDTHPAMCIPELLRVLLDDEHLEWDEAFDIVTKTISYTNHTVMPEALESWPIPMLREHLPRIYMLIEEINRRHQEKFNQTNEHEKILLKNTNPLWENSVRMANISTICSHSINGVAALHTQILKKDTLNSFYELMPEKFNNKTNGVSHRRFLLSANEELTKVLKNAIGNDFISDASKLEDLLKYQNDNSLLDKLYEAKRKNKERLTKYIKENNNIDVNPDSIFDIQSKRIHAYKRQLLNVFRVLNIYNEIKSGKLKDCYPQTFIFSGKSAGSYTYAKKIIKLINDLADIINKDNEVNKYIKVVFIENFCVSNAELMYPACDVSEQISTAGKEASGTGNMKFMFNGAVTLGTLDGANVEIKNLVGDDNIVIFGLKEEEIADMKHNNTYDPNAIVKNDDRLKLIMEQLVGNFFKSSTVDYWDIYDSLLNYGDEYFVIADFDDYVKKHNYLIDTYKDKYKYLNMSLVNIAKAGYFSSDRTIKEYYDEIWQKYK